MKCHQSTVCHLKRENVLINKTLPKPLGQRWFDRWPQTPALQLPLKEYSLIWHWKTSFFSWDSKFLTQNTFTVSQFPLLTISTCSFTFPICFSFPFISVFCLKAQQSTAFLLSHNLFSTGCIMLKWKGKINDWHASKKINYIKDHSYSWTSSGELALVRERDRKALCVCVWAFLFNMAFSHCFWEPPAEWFKLWGTKEKSSYSVVLTFVPWLPVLLQ